MILNLTQHPATAEQRAAGVVDLIGQDLSDLKTLLMFDELPTPADIAERAEMLAKLVGLANAAETSDDDQNAGVERFAHAAMIGGAPFLMGPLEDALRERGVQPLYAFSRRESIEETAADGSVVKHNVFRHLGFVEAV